jgi:metal-responsive CopG/Arc/MetJ family transcriptional regulator
MGTIRTQVTLPTNLIREIDALVGKKGRSAFIAEAAVNAIGPRRFNCAESREDMEDLLAARKSLKARTRISWSVVKRKSKTG